jgi:ankyrin repeat protein
LVFACCGSAHGQQEGAGTVVDVGSFTVTVPEIDDWTVDVDREKGTVEFSRTKQKLLRLFSSGAGGGTSMTVFKNRPSGGSPGLWLMTEQEMAMHFRKEELSTMEESSRRGVYKLGNVSMDSTQLEGRTYYRLAYTNAIGRLNATVEAILHLYFPPEFVRTKEFYGFLISESYVTGSIFASKDLEQIRSLMRSLQTSGSTSTLPGVGGELLEAASRGDSVRVKLLIEGGAALNSLPANGRGALALAALYGHESIVRSLIDRGASVNPGGENEIHAPLSSAILGRELEIARLLLEKGAQANGSPNRQWTPLIHAIKMHLDTAFVADLLARGADPNRGSPWPPLMHAANEGLAPVASRLIDHGATLDRPDSNGVTALMIALESGWPEVAGILLARGANPNAGTEYGTTPLMYAARRGDTTSLARLVQLGARINARNKGGLSPLLFAASEGQADCARLLLETGAEIEQGNNAGVTPLAMAAAWGHLECVRLLLDRKATIDARSTKGWTPLMFAADEGDSAIVRLLISRGAKLDLENDNGDTARDIADDKDFDSIVEMLENAESQKKD